MAITSASVPPMQPGQGIPNGRLTKQAAMRKRLLNMRTSKTPLRRRRKK